jgi:hypothetical protein
VLQPSGGSFIREKCYRVRRAEFGIRNTGVGIQETEFRRAEDRIQESEYRIQNTEFKIIGNERYRNEESRVFHFFPSQKKWKKSLRLCGLCERLYAGVRIQETEYRRAEIRKIRRL